MTSSHRSTAAPRHETTYETPSECELIITRTFNAPRAVVWAAFTDPKHLPNWQPSNATMPVCEIDLRPGGRWRYVYRNGQGRELGVSGTYRDVEPPRRYVQVIDHNGEESITETEFTEHDGRTTVRVSNRYASIASRDQALKYAKFGAGSSYERLDGYLTTHF